MNCDSRCDERGFEIVGCYLCGISVARVNGSGSKHSEELQNSFLVEYIWKGIPKRVIVSYTKI